MAPASGVTQKGTTTLSTIVLRSKETQVVIALLRSGPEIELKVLYNRLKISIFLTNFYMGLV